MFVAGEEDDVPSFMEDEQVDGVSLLSDTKLVNELEIKLRDFARARPNFLGFIGVSWFARLNMEHLKALKTKPYLVAPTPKGVRYLLYIDHDGNMFLQYNHNQYRQKIFTLDKERRPKVSISVKDTLLDGLVTRKILPDGRFGKLTFVIMDAIRCNGEDLTQKGVKERIATVRQKVMKKRLKAIKEGRITTEQEVIDLDIVEYVNASSRMMQKFFTEEFIESYKYLLRSFLFRPRNEGYMCGNQGKLLEWNIETREIKFNFRLKISAESQSNGDLLCARGQGREELNYATIELTDEMRGMDGSLIECRYVDPNWVFVRSSRNDREDHPNGLQAVKGKLNDIKYPVTREILLSSLKSKK